MASLARASPNLSWLACVFGSMAIEMTGAGNSITSSRTGSSRRRACRRWPCPETGGRGDVAAAPRRRPRACWRACGGGARSARLPLAGVVDRRSGADLARVDPEVGEEPTNGSFMILNASAENGSRSAARRLVSPSGSLPTTGGISCGAGRKVDHGVQQRLHAFVLEGGAAEHRHRVPGDGRAAERGAASAADEPSPPLEVGPRIASSSSLGNGLDHRRRAPARRPRAAPRGSAFDDGSAPRSSSSQSTSFISIRSTTPENPSSSAVGNLDHHGVAFEPLADLARRSDRDRRRRDRTY